MAKVAAAAQVDRRVGGAIVPYRTRGAHGISCQVCAVAGESQRFERHSQSPCNQWQGGQRCASVDATRARRARDALNRSICWPVVVVPRDAHAISCRSGGNSPGHRVWGARPARRLITISAAPGSCESTASALAACARTFCDASSSSASSASFASASASTLALAPPPAFAPSSSPDRARARAARCA